MGKRDVETGWYGGLTACRMVLDNPPNQIAWRGALSSSNHLELLEDHLRELYCRPITTMVQCPVRSGKFSPLRVIAQPDVTWTSRE